MYAKVYEAVSSFKEKIVKLHSTYAISSEQGNARELPIHNKCFVLNTAEPYLYMRTTPDKRVIIGGEMSRFQIL